MSGSNETEGLTCVLQCGSIRCRWTERKFPAAFEEYEVKFTDDRERVKRWKEALKTAAKLSGWELPVIATGHEAECIKQIVWSILRHNESHLVANLIGMESHVRQVKSLLGQGPGDVCICGIWGMGGIGKTTIARTVYNQILDDFDCGSFVENIRENGSDNSGIKSLQEKLLLDVLGDEEFELEDCDDGIDLIRSSFSRIKVLVVLDDVDNIKQLESLAGAREWFGPGSRIIITTRDENLLSYTQEKYAPELLNNTEAMELFSRYAFKANIPPKAYEQLSLYVVNHTGHLPLALKVIGSHLFGKDFDFWQRALDVLNEMPHKDINGILKLSFDCLNILEKKILLHIACFFKGRNRSYVTRILNGCGFEAVGGVAVLIQKSFLSIPNGNLHMHDLIQEMARSIVREHYLNTFVWRTKEIKKIISTIARLEAIEAIVETKHDEFSGYPLL